MASLQLHHIQGHPMRKSLHGIHLILDIDNACALGKFDSPLALINSVLNSRGEEALFIYPAFGNDDASYSHISIRDQVRALFGVWRSEDHGVEQTWDQFCITALWDMLFRDRYAENAPHLKVYEFRSSVDWVDHSAAKPGSHFICWVIASNIVDREHLAAWYETRLHCVEAPAV